MRFTTFYVSLFFILSANAQGVIENDSVTYYRNWLVIQNDTVYLELLDAITLEEDYVPPTREEKRAYYRLRKRVLKVYPFAREASDVFLRVQTNTLEIKKRRKKKKYARQETTWIKETFGNELRRLRRSEGKILIKLLHRNLQITAYELIRQYRSGLTARFWQTMASVYDADLKMKYRPEKVEEDEMIEIIIQKSIRDSLITESKLSPYQIISLK